MQSNIRKEIRRRFYKIKERCYNPHSKSYDRYGGRGIKICDEWLSDVEAFIDWAIANGYRKDLAIDRINNDGDYCPENCRFVTIKENNQNRRSTLFYTHNGKTLTLTNWCKELDLNYNRVLMRIRRGWSFEKAISTDKRERDVSSIIGEKFGRLTVLEYSGINSHRYSTFLCKCDCGKTVVVAQNKLVNGHTSSCGCLRKENIKENAKKSPSHIKHNSPLTGDSVSGR